MRKLRALLLLFLCGAGIGLGPRLLTSPAEAYKTCSACHRQVPESSHPGQHCPHCGAYWSYENTSYRTVQRHERIAPEVTIEYGDITFTCSMLSRQDALMVPARAFEKLGLVVEWTPQGTTFTRNDHAVTVRDGAGNVSPAPRERRGTLYVPLRAVAEGVGFVVDKQEGKIVLSD